MSLDSNFAFWRRINLLSQTYRCTFQSWQLINFGMRIYCEIVDQGLINFLDLGSIALAHRLSSKSCFA